MLLLAVICLFPIMQTDGSNIVTTTGPVRGKLNHDHDLYYYSYQGIPYAENPGDALRFKAPVPKRPWTEIFDATQPGPVCPQTEGNYNKSQMSEDCLVVNVYVPGNNTEQPLPVFVFVHGGGYKMLSGNADVLYGPQFYLKRDVIYVSLNYRLGALGFLSLENEEVPGNAGLKDVLLALKWIKANIDRFGGDSDMITIGGSSSGSSASHYLMLTDKTKGLFNQAFLTSGSAVSFRFIQKKPRKRALALANQLGLGTEDTNELIKNLTEVDAFAIVEAQENIFKDERSEMRQFGPFVPCIEPESDEAIITKNPLDIIKTGIPHKVPTLVGINSLEGIYYWATIKKNETLVENLPRLFADCIPPDVEYPKDSKSYQNLVDSISQFYFGGPTLPNFTLHNFLELLSDTQYTFNIDRWIRIYREENLRDVLYYYFFDFDGDLNWAKINYNVTEVPGTAHSDDLGYQFVTKITDHLLNNIDSRTQRMMDVMLTLFTNFMKYGNPTPDGYTGTEWLPYDTEGNYLLLTDNPSTGRQGPNARRFNFWHNVYQEYDEYVSAGGLVADHDYV